MECTLLLAEGCNLECKYCYEGEKMFIYNE